MSDIYYRGRVSTFLKDNIIESPGARIAPSQMYKAWTTWCRSKAYDPGTKWAFGNEMGQREFERKRFAEGSVYLNVRLKGDEQQEDQRAHDLAAREALESKTVSYDHLTLEVRTELRRLGFDGACPLVVVPAAVKEVESV